MPKKKIPEKCKWCYETKGKCDYSCTFPRPMITVKPLPMTIVLDTTEERAWGDWCNKHYKKGKTTQCTVYLKCYFSGIGTMKVAGCQTCKKEKDITNYDNW